MVAVVAEVTTAVVEVLVEMKEKVVEEVPVFTTLDLTGQELHQVQLEMLRLLVVQVTETIQVVVLELVVMVLLVLVDMVRFILILILVQHLKQILHFNQLMQLLNQLLLQQI